MDLNLCVAIIWTKIIFPKLHASLYLFCVDVKATERACLVATHIIFSLDDSRQHGYLEHVANMCGVTLLWEKRLSYPSSFYSNVNLETVAAHFLGCWWSINRMLLLKSFTSKRRGWEAVLGHVTDSKRGFKETSQFDQRGREIWSCLILTMASWQQLHFCRSIESSLWSRWKTSQPVTCQMTFVYEQVELNIPNPVN